MRQKVVVVDHHDSYTFNLVHLVASVTGKIPQVVEHDEVTADSLLTGGSGSRYTHIVLSPGPGNPDTERDFSVGRAILARADVPVLGVCLGLQGMVSVYGGRVAQVAPAHGEVAVIHHRGAGIFRGVPQDFDAVRYHSLACVVLPDVLEETAWCDPSPRPGPGRATGSGQAAGERIVMGVAHRDKPQWGVQFHPESVLTEHGATLVENFLDLV